MAARKPAPPPPTSKTSWEEVSMGPQRTAQDPRRAPPGVRLGVFLLSGPELGPKGSPNGRQPIGRSKSLALLQTADMTRCRRIESGPTFIPVPTGKLAGACEHVAHGCELLYPVKPNARSRGQSWFTRSEQQRTNSKRPKFCYYSGWFCKRKDEAFSAPKLLSC